MLPDSEKYPDAYPKDCTTRDYLYEGHSTPDQCLPFLQNAQLCIQGLSAALQESSAPGTSQFVNDGCNTFQNVAAATQYVENNILPIVPEGYEISISANQAVSSAVCSSSVTISVTRRAGVQVQYGNCHVDGPSANVCHEAGETILCTDTQNVVRNEVCCDTERDAGYGLTNAWTWGTLCPNTPPPGDRPSEGSCTATGLSSSCIAARADAESATRSCFQMVQSACHAGGRNLTASPCTPGEKKYGENACSVELTCPWKCM
jgi:hypothetical protein